MLWWCCVTKSQRDVNKHPPVTDRTLVTDQNKGNTMRTQLGEPMNFTGVAYRNMGELLLIDLSHFYGVLSYLYGSNTAASPKPHCNMDEGS